MAITITPVTAANSNFGPVGSAAWAAGMKLTGASANQLLSSDGTNILQDAGLTYTGSGNTGILQAGSRAVTTILAKSAIPFIGLSSGSVSAAGAISGITALPFTYASAYCYFPANALATSIAAGWYYCTFSSTTAGTAFLNTYTSGVPTIPASPTAVTDGRGAFTGHTANESGPTIAIPGNVLGPNGGFRVISGRSLPNNANTHQTRVLFGGTVIYQSNDVNTIGGAGGVTCLNRGIATSQISFVAPQSYVNPAANANVSSIDTTVSNNVVIDITRNTATDNLIIESWVMEIISDGT